MQWSQAGPGAPKGKQNATPNPKVARTLSKVARTLPKEAGTLSKVARNLFKVARTLFKSATKSIPGFQNVTRIQRQSMQNCCRARL